MIFLEFITLLIFGTVCGFLWTLCLEAKDKLDGEKYTEQVKDASCILLFLFFVTILSLLTGAII